MTTFQRLVIRLLLAILENVVVGPDKTIIHEMILHEKATAWLNRKPGDPEEEV